MTEHHESPPSPAPAPPPPLAHDEGYATATASASALRSTAATARLRIAQTPSSTHGLSPPPRRRSSLISFSSIDDATRTFTDEYINPRTRHRREGSSGEHEMTSWHSSPLAFAILPALGGLLFKDGSAFVTDVLLLGLAAIFMNWSIRLPWDWYYSAQALRRDVEPEYDDSGDDTAVETTSSAGGSPKPSSEERHVDKTDTNREHISKRERAAASLRNQELLALLATFVLPVLAAYLLHVIRAQLSGPSNGLVSDYNLSIFLLAAEIRPVRQVVRMVAKRTLYLQRTVTGMDDPFASAVDERSTISRLADRIADLEEKLSAHAVVPPPVNMAQKADVSDLSSEIRRRYEPRLEGLERAVRRYEKRTVTLAMSTEQKLLSLETRLQEALSLAAVAAQHSQNPGMVSTGLATLGNIMALPWKVAYSVCMWPLLATEQLYNKTKIVLLGPAPPRSPKRRSNRQDIRGREDSRTRDKQPLKKIVR